MEGRGSSSSLAAGSATSVGRLLSCGSLPAMKHESTAVPCCAALWCRLEVSNFRVLEDGQLVVALQLGGVTWHGLLPPPPTTARKQSNQPGKLSAELESGLESLGGERCHALPLLASLPLQLPVALAALHFNVKRELPWGPATHQTEWREGVTPVPLLQRAAGATTRRTPPPSPGPPAPAPASAA